MDQEGIHIFIVLTPTGKVSPNVLPLEEEQNIDCDLTSFFSRVKAGPSQGVVQGPDWGDASSVYEWIQQFTLDRGNRRLVKSFAGGPGTGKSRFLDEIERLLRHYIGESHEEIRNGFSNIVVINTTYGNGSPADSFDIRVISDELTNGQTSLALRILFEYFQPQYKICKLTFSEFNTICNKSKAVDFTLNTALRVIYADFIKQSKQETSPPLILVLGIDEFNNLHDLEKKACKELIKSIGGVMCNSPAKIFFIPILAGTIEGVISKYITGSMHEQILLPLRLLNDDDAINIGKKMNLFNDEYVRLHPYFRMSVSDVGGHVKTLEYYYEYFADQKNQKEQMKEIETDEEKLKSSLYGVNIGKVMEHVKHRIVNKYQLDNFSNSLSVPLAKAILGLPVGKMEAVKKENVKVEDHELGKFLTYRDLVSMGFVNLVPAKAHYLIRLPYLWVCVRLLAET
ncbi:hypothetical protein RhiirC2_856423 [Rhizophagus irregularis]|uniref:Crinkler family protein n=1 Tax=Rhizophagus irregularis TaxID=588596 RepID=A0A2N1MHR6_9GLOM|nr:hypothetical protein RhiirC2_856423 [Rhizophagus irregularis]